MKNGMIVDEDGTKRWYLDGELHREDGPAIVRANGEEFWYRNGRPHKEFGTTYVFTVRGVTIFSVFCDKGVCAKTSNFGPLWRRQDTGGKIENYRANTGVCHHSNNGSCH